MSEGKWKMAHAAWGPTGIGVGHKTHLYADYIWRLEDTWLLFMLMGEPENDFWLTRNGATTVCPMSR